MHFWSKSPENFARFNGGKFCLCIIDVQSACASVKAMEDGCMIRKWCIAKPRITPKTQTQVFGCDIDATRW